MKLNNFAINLTSQDPESLKRFYRDTVGLAPRPEMGEGAFQAGGATIFVDGHSDTHGPAKEPQRVLINFFVDDLGGEQSRLESKGAKFIRKEGKEEWGGVISTFLDPDGNYLQLIEYKPS
jgi:predicted enzyme related to lactoylglutathione lyase